MLRHDFARLDALKAKLDEHRPLNTQVLNNLHEDRVLQWTYNSNAIEGNTLTLKETKVALEGITVGGKTLREHFEAINHRDAILFVEELVSKQQPLDAWVIKSAHQLVLKNIDADNAGRYRDVNVLISGAQHRPPQALQVPEQMQAFIHWYNSEALNLHPVERAARVHCEFVKIHPFSDGNGCTSRLLMNLELMNAGFPATVITVAQRLAYYEALDKAHCCGDYGDFIALVANCVEQSFEPYWWALGVEGKKLSKDAVIRNFLITAADGKNYNTQHYSLPAMQDWETRLNRFLEATDREVLRDAGKVTAEVARAHALSEFEKYRVIQDKLFESDFDRFLKEQKGKIND